MGHTLISKDIKLIILREYVCVHVRAFIHVHVNVYVCVCAFVPYVQGQGQVGLSFLHSSQMGPLLSRDQDIFHRQEAPAQSCETLNEVPPSDLAWRSPAPSGGQPHDSTLDLLHVPSPSESSVPRLPCPYT